MDDEPGEAENCVNRTKLDRTNLNQFNRLFYHLRP